jgi:hypothetical protein
LNKKHFSQLNEQQDMDQAVAIATTLAQQLDIATQRIHELQAQLRESRAYADRMSAEKDVWKKIAESKQDGPKLRTAKDDVEEMLEDAAEKYAETYTDEDYKKMMELQRKYDGM